ncbi:hypothetical protein [Streptomyces sp. NPDC048665]|uniref:hypothetical protein n=1 Tax=Streptomyces sp. NPDC048665 TaxID=3155490 RepID=UPI0034247E9B
MAYRSWWAQAARRRDHGGRAAVQRKARSPNDSADLTEATERLRASEDRYDATPQPFQRRFTTSDLDDLPVRLDRHTADRHEGSSVAPAA